MQTMDSSEEADLELMFAEIRRYPLLTAEQEQEIDGRKWAAVHCLSETIADAPDLREPWPTFLTPLWIVRQK